MALELKSFCKVNLLLNILGKRPDGFHELETVMHPVALHDFLQFELGGRGIHLACSDVALPADSKNLVYRAAEAFLKITGITDGVRIHLEKKIPMAAGLGGGSGNAATTLLGLNEIFGSPTTEKQLNEMAASLGSDIPFFLQNRPALATGRGEKVLALDFFPALRGCYILLVHPGFGISTPWAYQQLSRFPEALNGKLGRAEKLISLLQNSGLHEASPEFYNSLEAPALCKYPLLSLFQEFFRENGAAVSLMSGSGSATFALLDGKQLAENLLEQFKIRFGNRFWTALLPFSQ
jgi:4-diphosphocytidyl-2-C-methyl-D-erythritol kinase